MNWLVLSYFISLGTLSYNGDFINQPNLVSIQSPSNTFETTLGAEAQLFDNHLFVGGSVETWEVVGVELFNPWESIYTFSAGLRGWGFEAGWRHECDHVVTSNAALPMLGFITGQDQLYLSYRASVKVF